MSKKLFLVLGFSLLLQNSLHAIEYVCARTAKMLADRTIYEIAESRSERNRLYQRANEVIEATRKICGEDPTPKEFEDQLKDSFKTLALLDREIRTATEDLDYRRWLRNSLDSITDQLIQRAIRYCGPNCSAAEFQNHLRAAVLQAIAVKTELEKVVQEARGSRSLSSQWFRNTLESVADTALDRALEKCGPTCPPEQLGSYLAESFKTLRDLGNSIKKELEKNSIHISWWRWWTWRPLERGAKIALQRSLQKCGASCGPEELSKELLNHLAVILEAKKQIQQLVSKEEGYFLKRWLRNSIDKLTDVAVERAKKRCGEGCASEKFSAHLTESFQTVISITKMLEDLAKQEDRWFVRRYFRGAISKHSLEIADKSLKECGTHCNQKELHEVLVRITKPIAEQLRSIIPTRKAVSYFGLSAFTVSATNGVVVLSTTDSAIGAGATIAVSIISFLTAPFLVGYAMPVDAFVKSGTSKNAYNNGNRRNVFEEHFEATFNRLRQVISANAETGEWNSNQVRTSLRPALIQLRSYMELSNSDPFAKVIAAETMARFIVETTAFTPEVDLHFIEYRKTIQTEFSNYWMRNPKEREEFETMVLKALNEDIPHSEIENLDKMIHWWLEPKVRR